MNIYKLIFSAVFILLFSIPGISSGADIKAGEKPYMTILGIRYRKISLKKSMICIRNGRKYKVEKVKQSFLTSEREVNSMRVI